MIADQLGHSRVSMSQDVYLGRRSVDPRVIAALEAADPTRFRAQSDDQKDDFGMARAMCETFSLVREPMYSFG